MSKTYVSKIIKKEVVAENTLKISFERPSEFAFQAGQHIQLAVEKLHYSDPKGLSRVFSICSSPLNKEVISVVFRETGSGFKKTLSELPLGSTVLIEGPLGFFTLPESKDGDHIFVAGGIGVAPFMSMIEQSVHIRNKVCINLIYTNRKESLVAFTEELQKLDKKSDWFSLNLVYGRIEQKHLTKYTNQNTPNLHWWIVGPPNMVTDVKYMVESLGIWEDKIHTEEFIGY